MVYNVVLYSLYYFLIEILYLFKKIVIYCFMYYMLVVNEMVLKFIVLGVDENIIKYNIILLLLVFSWLCGYFGRE